MFDNKQQLLAHLHTFSVAAKYLSFTMAAKELCLTQSAVSHRIRKLEDQLKFTLFIRKTRKLELTPEGTRVLTMLNTSFELIFSELNDIQNGELSGELYIGTSPYFASAWLLPKLKSFRDLYPNLSIKLLTKQHEVDFQFDPIDLGIFYGEGHYPDHFSERLFVGKRVPVCTPEYAKQFKLFGNPHHLKDVNFIHSGGHGAWKYWLDQVGLDIDCTQKYDLFTHEHTCAAALQSMGVSLGRLEFDRHLLESGELVAPFPIIDSHKGYDMVCPQGMQSRVKYQAFSKWIRSQLED
ncbi:LysR family transcriptional regulator [Vibrio sp. T187]|uniref:LysR substrate-binding domain-containing protein n=1 Tax=Vibrio TaxID=662 RepID=UPI0010C9EBAA|nr:MULTISPECIES: LysR substrate-binding domain-containing protein [Vibrio]MBW3697783.1 LysR family transcriptional regulator [Vibrio sp. T187]